MIKSHHIQAHFFSLYIISEFDQVGKDMIYISREREFKFINIFIKYFLR